MGKSKSFSTRKKRSKYSSLDKKSKTKQAKPKKLRRHDDSDSDSDSYSTDDSKSSAYVSVSSEDSYRGRKSRSNKRTKRRARSLSSSSEESFRSRKKKASRKKVDFKVRKKTTLKHKKKKKSSSSDSSDESEYESRRGRSQRRGNDSKSSKNDVKSRSKNRRYRSRSFSSSSRDSGGGDYRIEQKETDEKISKRLKSVITVARYENEEREMDDYKEEIVYEDGGYPSSKSNDSNGSNQSLKNEKREDLFDIKSTEPFSGDDQSVEGKPVSDGFVTKDSLGEKTDDIVEASANVTEDLETILRQKALENFRKFRGGNQMNLNSNNTRKDENRGALRSPCHKQTDLSQNDPKDNPTQGFAGGSVHSLQEEKILDGKNGSNESAPVENKVVKRDKVNMTFGRGISKPRLVTSALKQALSNCKTSKVEVPKVKLVNESGSGKLEATSVDGKTDCDKLNEASSSAGQNCRSQDEDKVKLPESLSSAADGRTVNNASRSGQDMNSSEGQADVKEGSQLERKTMSVMRGGELVQVSYKVYIPKKAPALTRRQLKR